MSDQQSYEKFSDLFSYPITRRQFLQYMSYLAAGLIIPFFPTVSVAAPAGILTRIIPGTAERIPLIGMGSWRTFHVGNNHALRKARTGVLRTFFELGGGMIDSSPMYGSSEEVIGYALGKLHKTQSLFSATKVWTKFQSQGIWQIKNSHRLWNTDQFDLLQIHNLLAWEKHLETLLDWKAQGLVRYIGITTSHGRRHPLFEEVMQKAPIDFVQFTYNIVDREAEDRLLPIAAERNLGVIINRPFQMGQLFSQFASKPLPSWSEEFDCKNWAQFFLKFIVAHPAVTCAIPATSRVDHMRENMGAMVGRLPDPTQRKKMINYIASL